MTNPNEALLSLAARVEEATGPDRKLDYAVAVAGGWHPPGIDPSLFINPETGPVYSYRTPRFTASLDAAMTLVPEGWSWSLYDIIGKRESVRMWDGGADLNGRDVLCSAATPALALTAACLRALSHGERG